MKPWTAPVLWVSNQPVDCAAVTGSVETLRPPNHMFHTIELSGATDPDGDSLMMARSMTPPRPDRN